MLEYKASKSQFWFEVGGQPADTFQVAEFYGHENISQLFSFEIKLISALENDLDLPDFLNQPAKLTILREDEKKELHGILSDLEETGRSKDSAFYRGVFVPRLWKLSLFYQSRVFQNLSVPDIVKEVFKAAGFGADDYKFDLQGNYKPREYCVQYRETDLNFISRLLEYEGIYYFFDHAKGKDVVMMVDNNGKNPAIEAPDEINSFVGEGFESEQEEVVNELVWRQKVVTGKVKLKDYNYRTPETALVGESQIDGKSPGLYYEYGEHFKTASEGEALAKIRNEEIEAARRIISGASNCRGFHAGFKFTLAKHYREALNGDYLLIQVSHVGSQVGGIGATGGAGGSTQAYRNQFSCIPASVQFRPPRLTPEPRIPGIMTSKVETAGGEYAHLDEDGRYRIKVPFDMSDKANAQASRAVRMAQPYSGSGYGMHFPVHAGTEMVWACIDGNVDRPLGLSTVPNPSQASPVKSGNKTINMIKTFSDNMISMDDTRGSERLDISTPYDNSISAGHDQTITVKNNRTIKVDGTHTETVKKDTAITISEGKYKHDVATGTAEYHVKGALTENYEDVQTTTVKKHIVITATDEHIHLIAGKEIKLTTGESEITMNKNGTITISGKTITIIGSEQVKASAKKVETTGQQEVKMGVGTQSVTCNASKVETGGAGITSAAIGVHEISGAIVKIN